MTAQRRQIFQLFGQGTSPPVVQLSLDRVDSAALDEWFIDFMTQKQMVITPHLLDEMRGALMAFYAFKDAKEYLTGVVEEHATLVGVFQNAKLGEPVGKGAEKVVHELPEHPNVVIGISEDPDLEAAIDRMSKEVGLLNELHAVGIPVTDVIGVVKYKGKAAILMRRYAEGSKSTVGTDKTRGFRPIRVGNSAHLNARSISDLLRIKSKLEEDNVRIDDIQFLIGSDGSVVLSDPLSVTVGGHPPTPNMIQMVYRLVEAAAQNELVKIIQQSSKPLSKVSLQNSLKAIGVPAEVAGTAVSELEKNYKDSVVYTAENGGKYSKKS